MAVGGHGEELVDPLGCGSSRPSSCLEVAELREVVTRQMHIPRRAERSLQRWLVAVPAGPREYVPERPPMNPRLPYASRSLRIQPDQVVDEPSRDRGVGALHERGGGMAPGEQHQASARPSRSFAPERLGLVREHVE